MEDTLKYFFFFLSVHVFVRHQVKYWYGCTAGDKRGTSQYNFINLVLGNGLIIILVCLTLENLSNF